MRQARCMNRNIGTTSMLAILGLTSGCISVRAPDKPIEINLNIKIDANVVVALQKDTKDLIDKNPELFPQ